ncbi:hypothetical protein CEXT_36871 [Caerostris extrusa]|uniref:Uncharacterized protein n=1 Tax=Caerostris extrusa TaxID=172846 RepID=A0AAV4ULN5_CAEEX|nr:hypothetical protein CEXT_36871 [Caerostris extrusa]
MLNTAVTQSVSLILLGSIGYLTYDSIGTLYLLVAGFSCFFYVSFLLAKFCRQCFAQVPVSSSNKAVFITGCDKGFGQMLARRLDGMGYKVFAGCLEPQGREVQKLKDTVSSNLVIVPLDVTKDESAKEAFQTVKSQLGNCELWALVNNAGVIERGVSSPATQVQRESRHHKQRGWSSHFFWFRSLLHEQACSYILQRWPQTRNEEIWGESYNSGTVLLPVKL